ncbi:Hypothetical protein NTJ_09158 [Nesidiocoris tenuis]|uniref:Secreted protein n=1 Tax=Nesidiocoris tenuis TaxID=355587 RepID=A0ABN7AY94_9HEMI|nr:Hypothetical protein NTJ_09158 [Nesidiocoris tenuis]
MLDLHTILFRLVNDTAVLFSLRCLPAAFVGHVFDPCCLSANKIQQVPVPAPVPDRTAFQLGAALPTVPDSVVSRTAGRASGLRQ